MSIESSNRLSSSIDLTRLRWRYVICLGSFYVNGIVWGFISSTGIFEDAFKINYQLSSFQSTLPCSIQIATMSIFSVFSSILTIKYGVRWITLIGAFISTIGSILSASIGNYWAFCLFYGCLVGTGEALMLVPAVLAIPSYFHSNRLSLATASAVSGASIGMLIIPYFLEYFLQRYGLRGATLLSSCLWLSVALAGALFGKGVTTIKEKENSINDQNEHSLVSNQSDNNGLIYSRRTSFLPTSAHYHSPIRQDDSNNEKMMTKVYEELISKNKSRSSLHSSPVNIQSSNEQISILTATHTVQIKNDSSNKNRSSSKYFQYKICSEICTNTFRILIVSMIFIWSFDETKFLFLIDLLKSSQQVEQRSTLIIAITGLADLAGQLIFGYLGDVECINLFILWTCTSIIAGLSISIAPLMSSYGLISLSIVFGIHAFFLSAPNALGNVIMIEVVGMHHYAVAYGFSLLVSGSTSLFGYPLLGLLKDKTKNWTIPFALVGLTMIVGGIIVGIIPIKSYFQKKKSKELH